MPAPPRLYALFVRRGFCVDATAAPHGSRHAPRRTVETSQDGLARNRCGSWLASDAPRGRRSISRALQKHRQAPGGPHSISRHAPAGHRVILLIQIQRCGVQVPVLGSHEGHQVHADRYAALSRSSAARAAHRGTSRSGEPPLPRLFRASYVCAAAAVRLVGMTRHRREKLSFLIRKIRLKPFLVVHFPNILLPPFFRCDHSGIALVSASR
jgi:hypothetical protein